MRLLSALIILSFCFLAPACSKNNNKPEIETGTAYIVSDNNITIAGIKTEDVPSGCSMGPRFYKVNSVIYTSLDKKFAGKASSHGIVKSGLNFSLHSHGGDNPYHLENAIYIEKNGTIKYVDSLYINYGRVVTKYRIIHQVLYVKELTPLETDDLNESLKKRIKNREIFIY